MLPEKDQELTTARRMIVEQRIGSFLLPFELVEGRPSDIMALLATTLVLRCEMRGDMQAYEYSAYCPVFDPLARHGMPPRYEVAVAPDMISFVPRVPPGMALVGEAKRQGITATAIELAKAGCRAVPADYPTGSAAILDVENRAEWRAPVNDRNGGRG